MMILHVLIKKATLVSSTKVKDYRDVVTTPKWD